ncbi:MAG: hypothetical protein GJ680_21260 [Alteromonadaceae bacterium]|nr:hypothetical protein [Alteromonadaceae bacterium]
MAVQDRTGNKYEQLLAHSIQALGYEKDAESGLNYLHPSKRPKEVVIDGTYIQPDLVVKNSRTVEAVIYVTHWSKSRNCAFKYWRTWEEQAQQRVVLEESFISINSIFEALPEGTEAQIFTKTDQLPIDTKRDGEWPIAFRGWYPGTTYALIESFDVTIAFPVGYQPVKEVVNYAIGQHDEITTKLLKTSLSAEVKPWLDGQWCILKEIKSLIGGLVNFENLQNTESRYRIGLLHVYLFYRLFSKLVAKDVSLEKFVKTLAENAKFESDLTKLTKKEPFSFLTEEQSDYFFDLLASIYVRSGKNPIMFCEIKDIELRGKTLTKIEFNKDLRLCLKDLGEHLDQDGFVNAMISAFNRYDKLNGVEDALLDLANPELVKKKEQFVRNKFEPLLKNPNKIAELLEQFASVESDDRVEIAPDSQNWILEMLIYLTKLNPAEDIYVRLTSEFEKSGHSVWNHAPYSDYAKILPIALQGIDLCAHWKPNSKKITLTEPEYKTLVWKAIANSICNAFEERENNFEESALIIKRYQEVKARRIISSDLNGFEILIEHFLGDICYLSFVDDSDEAKEALKARIRPTWQTEVTKSLWNVPALETWLEGVSKNGEWLIKVQSAQDGNEGHKTKELAGRSRAMQLEWNSGKDALDRKAWSFKRIEIPKTALVLDGDWSSLKKKNLYEAGWDWVGDVSQLSELRTLIKKSD